MDQWLHFDAFEVLPESPVSEPAPPASRYSHQISVFGAAFQDELQRQKTFLTGCGALGCELLKNYALMGIATAEGGIIHCTDNDHIKVQNYSFWLHVDFLYLLKLFIFVAP